MARALGPAATFSQGSLAVSPDTGPGRFAAAVGTQTIALFDPTWKGRYGLCPPGRIIDAGVPPCTRRDDALGGLSPLSWLSAKRLLVARLDNIGDLVLCTPALATIRAHLPNVHVTLLASPGGSRAAAILPHIDDVVAERVVWQDVGGRLGLDPAREGRMVEMLRALRLDGAVIFTSFAQTPYPLALLLRLADVPLRAGTSKDSDDGVLTHHVAALADSLHQAERNLHLLESLGFTARSRYLELRVPEEARIAIAFKLREWGLREGEPFALMHTSASCSSRMYDPTRFGEASRMIRRQLGLVCLLTGHDRDRQIVERVAKVGGSSAIPLAGQTSLAEFAALIEMSTLVVSNNTSTMHFADAFRRPMVILFAGTELEEQWRPRAAPARLLRRPTHCSPCYLFECAYAMECLDIPPSEIAEAAAEVLDSAS